MDKHLVPTVGIRQTDRSSPQQLEAVVDWLIGLSGEASDLHLNGARVLIKPDLMLGYPSGNTSTTHLELIAAVARRVRKLGGHVFVGDSPFVLGKGMADFWQRTGLEELAVREGVELVSFEQAGSEAVAVETRVYYVSRAALDAEVVINIPRLKRDPWTGFAGAIRNMIGVLPGFQKGLLLKKAASPKSVARILVDVFSAVRPAINIVDALELTNGNGKVAGGGFLIGACDAVAVDTVLGDILSCDPHRIYTTRFAADAGLGIGWMEGIRVEGESVESVRANTGSDRGSIFSGFIPGLKMAVSEPYVWMRSDVDEFSCDNCGICVKFCPTRALRFDDGTSRLVIKRDLCINCWAGLANCPRQAISVRKSRMVDWLFRC
ncbi:MAG: DUF362 domain-containing protein [Candidatus Zixiibacteriota bacterium]